ncbi:MAG: hypothetical protein LBG78_07120 [Azoarcus sp.]|jgi:type IV secretion system protein VirB8/type IV secretion system protein PtlE|nr:hypothetical protein [Azoarcus sp.]
MTFPWKRLASGGAAQEPPKQKPADEFAAANCWDASRTAQIEQSERRAWAVAACSAFLVVLALAVIVIMTPLKQTVPYIVRVDNVTGAVDIVTVLGDQRIGYDEALDKYWLSKFVRARETYDWYTIGRDYDEARLLAGPAVGKQYTDLFVGEKALDKTLGKHQRVTVEVLGVSPDGHGSAAVRYIRTVSRANDGGAGRKTNHVATIGYEYLNPSRLTASERMLNPLGFQVTSYRTDEEFGAAEAAPANSIGGGQQP